MMEGLEFPARPKAYISVLLLRLESAIYWTILISLVYSVDSLPCSSGVACSSFILLSVCYSNEKVEDCYFLNLYIPILSLLFCGEG